MQKSCGNLYGQWSAGLLNVMTEPEHSRLSGSVSNDNNSVDQQILGELKRIRSLLE